MTDLLKRLMALAIAAAFMIAPPATASASLGDGVKACSAGAVAALAGLAIISTGGLAVLGVPALLGYGVAGCGAGAIGDMVQGKDAPTDGEGE